MSDGSRRRVLVATMVVCSLAFGGCLTLDPSITANTDDSAVFESLSVSESWASQRTRAKATLRSSPEAGNVSQITVVTASGTSFSTVNLDPGQTSVVLELPANRNATLVATDTVNGTTIEKLNVTTGGDKLL
ncbi:hypothetical protein [Halococcus agarilyticus]|uniref:hypothetical protein n=1 Tax=Halococcus agarilyticus TaxID=1232219 RepID=UPI0009AC742D|nr:hypothetical protein [Halococcus agarilyticus]